MSNLEMVVRACRESLAKCQEARLEKVARAIQLTFKRNIHPDDEEAWLDRTWRQSLPAAKAAMKECYAPPSQPVKFELTSIEHPTRLTE